MQRREFVKGMTGASALAMMGASGLYGHNLGFSANSETEALSVKSISQQNEVNTMFPTITTLVKVKGKEVKVHALCTGTVATKTAFRTRKGGSTFAKVNILLDSHFTEYMPIWVWVIEHPEGTIVIDTGEVAAAMDVNAHLAKESAMSRFMAKSICKFNVTENDALLHKLNTINLRPENVRLVALTHLHQDHTDGLLFFPKTEIVVNEFEFKHPYSNLPTTYPTWFKPRLVNYINNRVEVFDQAFPLTTSEDVLYIPTPGHTRGHSSVIFKTDDFDLFFAGDITYNQDQLVKDELAGVNIDYSKTKTTYLKIKTYAAQRPTLYLPSHDGLAGQRLLERKFL